MSNNHETTKEGKAEAFEKAIDDAGQRGYLRALRQMELWMEDPGLDRDAIFSLVRGSIEWCTDQMDPEYQGDGDYKHFCD